MRSKEELGRMIGMGKNSDTEKLTADTEVGYMKYAGKCVGDFQTCGLCGGEEPPVQLLYEKEKG